MPDHKRNKNKDCKHSTRARAVSGSLPLPPGFASIFPIMDPLDNSVYPRYSNLPDNLSGMNMLPIEYYEEYLDRDDLNSLPS